MAGRRWLRLWALAALGAAASVAAAQGEATAPTALALDRELMVGGVAVACTGIGQTKQDPKWQVYSVRVEFSDPHQDYLANEAVALSDTSGKQLAVVSCEGPWILFKLPAGTYRARGWLPGAPARAVGASFRAPSRGQLRVVLRFPDT
jgi:hypothetical protein